MNLALSAFGLGESGGLMSSASSKSSLAAGSSALAALAAIGEGAAKAQSAKMSAMSWRAQADQEFVQGQSEVGGLKRQLLDQMGSRTAAYGASGVDVGQGVAADTRGALSQEASAAQRMSMLSASIRSRRDMVNAIMADQQAKDARRAGLLGSVGLLLKGLTFAGG